MIPAPFEYAAPTSLEEALSLLAQHGEDAKLLAGGHSLVPLMKLRLAGPAMVIDLGRVPGLSGISRSDGALRIGAMTTHAAVERSAEVAGAAPALAEAAHHIGDRQVRALGTIGGSVVHGDPAADLPAVMLALGAEMVLRSRAGERTVKADDFFVGLLETAVRPDEILVEVRVPAGARSAYEKYPNPASHYAIVGVAAALDLQGGTVRSARLGVTGAAPVAYRARGAEKALRGQPLTEEAIGRAAEAAYDGRELLGDIHASAEYRAHLVRVFTRRVLRRLAG